MTSNSRREARLDAAEHAYEAHVRENSDQPLSHVFVNRDALRAALAAADAQGWRPISEAPRDGTPVLGYHPKYGWAGTIRWDDGDWEVGNEQWEFNRPVQPTHWMPLPPPPGSEPADALQDEQEATMTKDEVLNIIAQVINEAFDETDSTYAVQALAQLKRTVARMQNLDATQQGTVRVPVELLERLKTYMSVVRSHDIEGDWPIFGDMDTVDGLIAAAKSEGGGDG